MFQLRHKTLGIWQGMCLGLGFFYLPGDLKNNPDEQQLDFGIRDVENGPELAKDLCAMRAREHPEDHAEIPWAVEDFVVEPLFHGLSLEELQFLHTAHIKYGDVPAGPYMRALEEAITIRDCFDGVVN